MYVCVHVHEQLRARLLTWNVGTVGEMEAEEREGGKRAARDSSESV